MKYNKPDNLVLWAATYVTVFMMILTLVIALTMGSFSWYLLIIWPVSLIFTYFLLEYFLKKFIFEKIKPIYKTVLNIQTPAEEKRFMKDGSLDIINNVNEHVISWGDKRRNEIEELKRLEVYRREFIGNVSHELKTPIFNIQGYVLTLLDGGLEDAAINRNYLLKTEENIDRMITIINDLDMISRLEASQLRLNEVKFDLIGLVKETMEILEPKAQKKKINISLNKRYEKAIYVTADMERIRQVLTNLIENSIKYGKKRGNTVISLFDIDEHFLTEISDDGSGIDSLETPRIFERFYRTEKARSKGKSGRGLGLAIVKHIIEAHNQTIKVRSKLGEGTTFAFTLRKA